MVLVILLVAYMIRRRLDGLNRWSVDGMWRRWFSPGAQAKAGKERSVWPGVVRVLAPAVLLAVLVYLAGSLGLRFAVYPLELLVLIGLMGAPGWRQVLEAYSQAWGRGDMQSAWRHVQQWLPASERGEALSPETMHLSLSRALMVSIFERFFLVVFWYLVGGIALAFLARGMVALAEHWPQAAARERFRKGDDLVGWIPARLLACTFGLAGDLSGWLQKIRGVIPGFGKNNTEVLMAAANGSLTGYALDPARFSGVKPQDWPNFGGRSLSAIRDLLNRSMLVWICVIALLVIAGVA
jgi:AmpE protein